MTDDDALFRFRLRTFALASELRNVRAAYKAMGIHPSTYHAWRRQLIRFGPEILRVGAENQIPSSCGDLVLVEEATQPVTPPNCAEVKDAGCARYGAGRGVLIKGAVRPMSVVVLHVYPQHAFEVASADDEQSIQTLSAQAAEPALHNRVRLGRSATSW